jgi:hypothetical protein
MMTPTPLPPQRGRPSRLYNIYNKIVRRNFRVLSQNPARKMARVHQHNHRHLSDHLAEKIQSRLFQQKLGQFRRASIEQNLSNIMLHGTSFSFYGSLQHLFESFRKAL